MSYREGLGRGFWGGHNAYEYYRVASCVLPSGNVYLKGR